MKPEIEAKILAVDIDAVRTRLRNIGAECEQPMRLMRRAIVQNEATGKDSYVRVRDEGDKVTLTYKTFESLTLHGTQEIETIVGDYDAAIGILTHGGMQPVTTQETRRETWRLGDVEVMIDEWPWLKPFIEVEGPSEQHVRDAVAQLGYDWESDAIFGDVMVVYRAEYPHLTVHDSLTSLARIRFDDPLPDLLQP